MSAEYRAVPRSLRQASYGLGATQWQTIWHHVLPQAIPGVLTGSILAVSRAIAAASKRSPQQEIFTSSES